MIPQFTEAGLARVGSYTSARLQLRREGAFVPQERVTLPANSEGEGLEWGGAGTTITRPGWRSMPADSSG